jgi:hypothetical protein
MPTNAEIEALIQELLASNDSPGYGIAVRNVTSHPGDSAIDVDVRFLSGRIYCCAEPACHLPKDLSRIPLLAGFTVRWHCRVEQGARLTCLEALGLPIDSPGFEYEFVTGRSS